jgi:hypothetical protein
MTLSDRAVLEQAKPWKATQHKDTGWWYVSRDALMVALSNCREEAEQVAYQLNCDFAAVLRQQQPLEAVPVPAPVEYEGLALALCNAWVRFCGSPPRDLEAFREYPASVQEGWLAVAKRAEEWFTAPYSELSPLLPEIRARARLGEE